MALPGGFNLFDGRFRGLPVATLSELRRMIPALLNPGFQNKPWAEIGERFQRYVLSSPFTAALRFLPNLFHERRDHLRPTSPVCDKDRLRLTSPD